MKTELHPTRAGAVPAPGGFPDQTGFDALLDAAEDAAVTLGGIADALTARTASDPDDLLEALALAADSQARGLRRALGR